MQYQPKVLKGCKLRLLVNESSNDTIKTYIYDGILYQVDSITRHITLAYGEEQVWNKPFDKKTIHVSNVIDIEILCDRRSCQMKNNDSIINKWQLIESIFEIDFITLPPLPPPAAAANKPAKSSQLPRKLMCHRNTIDKSKLASSISKSLLALDKSTETEPESISPLKLINEAILTSKPLLVSEQEEPISSQLEATAIQEEELKNRFLTPPSSALPSPANLGIPFKQIIDDRLNLDMPLSQLVSEKEECKNLIGKPDFHDPLIISKLFQCKFCLKLADRPIALPCGIIVCAKEAFHFKFCHFCLNEHLDDYKCNETINGLIRLGMHKLTNMLPIRTIAHDKEIKTKKSSLITCFSMLIETLNLKAQFYNFSEKFYKETCPNNVSYEEVCQNISFEPPDNSERTALKGEVLSYLINMKYDMKLIKNVMNDKCHQKSIDCFHCIYAINNGSDPEVPFFLHITKQCNESNKKINELIELTINHVRLRYKLWSVFAYGKNEYHHWLDPKIKSEWYKYEFGGINKSSLAYALSKINIFNHDSKFENMKYMLIYIKC